MRSTQLIAYFCNYAVGQLSQVVYFDKCPSHRVCLITLRNSLRPPEVVRVVQAAAASASASSDVELYKSSTAHLVRKTHFDKIIGLTNIINV